MPTKLVATATTLEGSKKNYFRSFIYGQSYTNPANFVKIGPVDVEIIGQQTDTIDRPTHKPRYICIL